MGKAREEHTWESGAPATMLRCLEPGQREVQAAGTKVGQVSRVEPGAFKSLATDELTR